MADKKAPVTRASTRNKLGSTSLATTPPPPPVPAKTTRSRAAASSVATAKAVKKPVAAAPVKPTAIAKKKASPREEHDDATTEPIMAFLRVRPHLSDDPPAAPYLRHISDTTVTMLDPSNNRSYNRTSSVALPASYSFTRVFSEATQAEFFTKTTLPLVKNVLQGQNALLFAYGATNAGKTYTMQGGSTPETAGILPRAIDVLFNSTEGCRNDNPKYKPARLHGVDKTLPEDIATFSATPEPLLTEVIGQMDASFTHAHVDETKLAVDKNYEVSIWISYAEVYNDKVYDLLESLQEGRGKIQAQRSKLPHQVLRQALTLKPSPTSDDEPSGKFVHGLRQYLVKTAAEAKSLINLGQLHRRVYGTLANSASSRSHGIVFVKILRGHRGERNDPSALQVARLTLVDLAGSERTKYTHATGERLKEAGNINNSLMVLGQCLETLRSNQRKLGLSLSPEGAARVDTRDVKKGLSIVPFRHSKLTEILQDYFVGDARAAMIVNVNPYDTGYDENSHVMKFAALAREVLVAPAPAPIQRVIPEAEPGVKKGKVAREVGRFEKMDTAPKRKVTISIGRHQQPDDAVIEVTELDESVDSDDVEDDYPTNPLVDALFEEIDRLRLKTYELELHVGDVEATTRAEVTEEMEGQMRRMEAMYEKRLREEVENNNRKMDSKIDMLLQTGMLGSPVKRSTTRAPVPVEEGSDDSDESMDDDSRPPSPSRKPKQPKYSVLGKLADDVAGMSLTQR